MKRNATIGGGIFLLVIVTFFFLVIWSKGANAQEQADQSISRLAINYIVRPQVEGKLLSVSIKMTPSYVSPEKMLYLDAGDIEASQPVCTDSSGSTIEVENLNGVWEIGPLKDNAAFVEFSYDVKLGGSSGEDFRVKGDMYDDLLVFQGKQVLMLPWLDNQNLSHMERYVESVAFQMLGENNWQTIIPFAATNSRETSFQVDSPTWYDFYDISNSSFCFGTFEPLKFSVGGKEGMVYVDKAIKSRTSVDDLSLVKNFYSYYAKIFQETLNDCPVVLLRGTAEDNSMILGGVGGRGMALSLAMSDPNDCQTMSRSLYHAFFDSKVAARNLHYQPNLWLYDGLANYYVDLSVAQLPAEMRHLYGIEPTDSMNQKYMRYLFFSLKDPVMMAVSADMEQTMPNAQQEFYYGIKVPLILHTINHFTGDDNGIIRYLTQTKQQDIDVSRLMKDMLGKNETVVRQYFSGASFIPNYWEFNGDGYSQEQIVQELASYEDLFADLYQRQYITYPYDPVSLMNTDLLRKEIDSRKLSFASAQAEKMVQDCSETLYLLLMQNALRANICEIEDPGAKGTKMALNTAENAEKWMAYLESAGKAR